MREDIIQAAEEIAMFCRLNMHVKRELPIRSSEMGLLIYVQKQDQPVTPLTISEFFQIAKPSVTAMISGLINKNYLIKEASACDARSYTVSITDKGKELVASTRDEYFKVIEFLKEKMGAKDFNVFIQLLDSANKALKEAKS